MILLYEIKIYVDVLTFIAERKRPSESRGVAKDIYSKKYGSLLGH